MLPDRFVTMANQIARFFASQGGEPATAVADHLRKFWDPRMRIALIGLCKDNSAESGLDPLVVQAVKQIQQLQS